MHKDSRECIPMTRYQPWYHKVSWAVFQGPNSWYSIDSWMLRTLLTQSSISRFQSQSTWGFLGAWGYFLVSGLCGLFLPSGSKRLLDKSSSNISRLCSLEIILEILPVSWLNLPSHLLQHSPSRCRKWNSFQRTLLRQWWSCFSRIRVLLLRQWQVCNLDLSGIQDWLFSLQIIFTEKLQKLCK